jgi:hypothetical protein
LSSSKDVSPKQLSIEGLPSTNSDYIASVFDLTEEKVEKLKRVKPKLLGIRCRRSECQEGLHCFDSVKRRPRFQPGKCQSCGVDLVQWSEVWTHDVRDVEKKFSFFQTEWIRHFFFHVPITDRIRRYAETRGLDDLGKIIERQLRSKKMLNYMPPLDIKQTAMLDGTIVHWARHAVACCCRRCMKYWHNVSLDHELSEDDIQYFKELSLKFITKRMPNLMQTPAVNRN